MKQNRLVTIQECKPGSFVFEKKNALAPDFCNEVMQRFEACPEDQYLGRVGQMASADNSIKRSTDLVVSGKSHWQDVDRALFRSLGIALREFRLQYPFFSGSFKDMGYGLQRTLPGEFYHWHIDGGSHDFSNRQLVAIFYLNDVEEKQGGTTDFLHQGINVTPEAGKLILFPPFWTHKHRGAEVISGQKYIATTWVVFA